MTYNAQEQSATGGAPVELYLFQRGAAAWRYTSADETQTYLSQTYLPAPIARGPLDDIGDLARAEMEIQVPHDLAVASQFIAYPPGEVVTLKIFRRHRTDPDSELRVIWLGRVLTAKWGDAGNTLICEPVTTSLQRMGLRRQYGRQCPHVLYSPACGVLQGDFEVVGDVTGISGSQVTVLAAAAHADGYFEGGFLWWQLPDGRKDARMIVGHSGDTLTLAATLPALSLGDSVGIYPGCDHTLAQCNSRFSNSENHGGWMFVPRVNPFNGSMVY